MRVHPSILAPKASKWQFTIAFCLLAFLLLINVLRGPREVVVADSSQTDKKIEVVVAQKTIQVGEPLDTAALILEQRPINTLPSDVITSFDAVKNKVAAGPIPAGYALAQTLLADPVANIPVVEGPAHLENKDPIDLLLEEIKNETVAVRISFVGGAPPRGTRVALALADKNGGTILLVEEAWIYESQGDAATVRVDSNKALFLQSAKELGRINFIEIPLEGVSPFEGKAVNTIEDVKVGMGLMAKPSPTPAADPLGLAKLAAPEKRRFRNYAWVSGAGIRYGIDEQGQMHIVDGDGVEVQQIMPQGFK